MKKYKKATKTHRIKKEKTKRRINIPKKIIAGFNRKSFADKFTQTFFRELGVLLIAGYLKKEIGIGAETDRRKGKVVLPLSNNKDVQSALAKAEDKIGRALNASVDNDDDDDNDDDEPKLSDRLPNLKYAKQKYENMESVLKYVESPDDKGGVKLVIMNFND